MNRRAQWTLGITVVAVAGSGGAASATLPPDEGGGTDFVRRQAEADVTAYFAESGTSVSDVACAAPPEDAAGAQMLCYATDSAGNVITAVATINDLGGIEITPAGGAPASTTPPPPAPSPVLASYNGTGSAVRPVDPITRPTIVRVTHDGVGAFSVQPQQGGVAAGEPLLNVTGAADGRYLVGLGGTISGFAITADGNWTLQLDAVSSAQALAPGSPASGDTPDVLSYAGAADPVTIDYTGTAPIVVRAVTSAGTAVVVDEPGAFSGEVTLPPGPGNVLVEAVGPWTVSLPAPPATSTAPPTTAAAATTAVTPTTGVAASASTAPTTSAPPP